ncbi:MAG: hypothetical protein MSC31_19410 [Solirubrobacteraceae bacterium MAG38_C4-C5]|nr:hypothetical protein [Candidatus Siliceabacter maunaloa]
MAEFRLIAEVLAIAEQIVRGDVEPYRGAAAIWARMAEEEGEYRDDLRVFVGLASEWQDHPHHRDALDGDIRDEARQLVERARRVSKTE